MNFNKKNLGSGRRSFLKLMAASTAAWMLTPLLNACQKIIIPSRALTPTVKPTASFQQFPSITPQTLTPTPGQVKNPDVRQIFLVKTDQREAGIRAAFTLLDQNPIQGKTVLLKPNFNSADPAPASTHPETLRTLVTRLQDMGASDVTLADRSGMGHSRNVMQALGIFEMARDLDFNTLSFEDLTDASDWELIQPPKSHWQNGFPFPRQALEAGAIVQTCCLKPHRFGGHFTLSLKNSVGMVGKYFGSGGHNYMNELHNSTYQRLMIAETNLAYNPALVVLDGVEAFIDMGPDVGTKVWGNLILVGKDRIAIDVIGLATLRLLGLKGDAARGRIRDQEQISRAMELNLGITDLDQIEIITSDEDSREYAGQIMEVLNRDW